MLAQIYHSLSLKDKNFFFLKLLIKILSIFFYRTYFGNKRFIFLVNLIKANIPFRYDFNYNLPNIESLNEIRKTKLKSKFKLNKFEKILRDLFFEFLPFYYLEQISNLKDLSKNLFLPSVKNRKIYTAAACGMMIYLNFGLLKQYQKIVNFIISNMGATMDYKTIFFKRI